MPRKSTLQKNKTPKLSKAPDKAWVLTVDMGYGHQRAAYPLRDIASQDIICANNYPGIPETDHLIWSSGRKWYEVISGLKGKYLIGDFLFNNLIDKMQEILPFYPRRDLSKPNGQVKQNYFMMRKLGWGRNLIEYLNKEKRPLISTFFTPAFFAEEFGFKDEIYCLLCDADISRAWAPLEPQKSRINYLAPNKRVVERLKLYGVPEKRIFLTGFPLPKENIGGPQMTILKKDLGARLRNLDPHGIFHRKYGDMLEHYLGKVNCQQKKIHPLTITFAVGGAGAQRDLGLKILRSLAKKLKKDELHLNLVAGVRNDVYNYFKDGLKSVGLEKCLDKNIKIIFATDKFSYFAKFNKALRTTDILWTKPSELSFYTGLGLPIVIAPPIGSQEQFNQRWLKSVGSGMCQYDPSFCSQWLFDWVESGWLAEAAMQGFLDVEKMGTYNIEHLVLGHRGWGHEFLDLG